MRLIKFEGDDVHGTMSFRVDFQRDLTFLTGINGSGKTTVLNAIQALIAPNLFFLAETTFSKLAVEIENESVQTSIRAVKADARITLSTPHVSEVFSYSCYQRTGELPLTRHLEVEQDYYRELLSSKNDILTFIATLPTPMFLGLDRRANLTDDAMRRSKAQYYRPPERLSRNVFNASAYGSLSDAADMANNANRTALISAGRIGDDLLRKMLLKLLEVNPAANYAGDFSIPTKADLQEIKDLKSHVDVLPQILALPRNEVRNKVLPFLKNLEQIAKDIPQDKTTGDILAKSKGHEPEFLALLSWSANNSELKRIRTISEIVTTYNDRRKDITEPTDKYIKIVNKFLKDSGKKFQFDENGYACFEVEKSPGKKPLQNLSSGEAQIFVILTHLAFNPAAQQANVFIIDEPELSLHVQWQEIFVDSVISSNAEIQFVMATHSPSIIQRRTKKCVDLSRKRAN